MSDFACVPVCAGCRDKPDGCQEFAPKPEPASRFWAPNTLPMVRAKCGCRILPWPLVHKLGERIKLVHCDRHGWQPFKPDTLLNYVRDIDPEWYDRIIASQKALRNENTIPF